MTRFHSPDAGLLVVTVPVYLMVSDGIPGLEKIGPDISQTRSGPIARRSCYQSLYHQSRTTKTTVHFTMHRIVVMAVEEDWRGYGSGAMVTRAQQVFVR